MIQILNSLNGQISKLTHCITHLKYAPYTDFYRPTVYGCLGLELLLVEIDLLRFACSQAEGDK